ncbi:hypothetical protein [Haliangium ochraceum]|uniref:Uncharacterized protein n=1 Tax=Haliangium ochraceum (strain DSM 14365 / JCM 11303 / SMP-2) TaxID=502025 RepID=D0LZD5_HALO1|nr:hypothetical protein [Haliangium ochraceum]ACY16397.1 conserved hypothetical protein [Haliangium ochraceum DSM 14365]
MPTFPVLAPIAAVLALAAEPLAPKTAAPQTAAGRLALVHERGDVYLHASDGRVLAHLRCPQPGAPPSAALPEDSASASAAVAPPLAEDAALANTTEFDTELAPVWQRQRGGGLTGEADSAMAAHERATQVAWFQGAAYIACSAGTLLRWREPEGAREHVLHLQAQREHAPAMQPPARILALAGGRSLWLIDEHHRLWSSGDGEELAPRGRVPEPPRALVEWRDGLALAIAADTGLWFRTHDEAWTPLLGVAARALATRAGSLLAAGAAGVLELDEREITVHSSEPARAIAVWNDAIWIVDERGQPRPLRDHERADASFQSAAIPASTPTPAAALRRPPRAGWAPWLPELVAQLDWQRMGALSLREDDALPPVPHALGRDHALQVSLWLAWRWRSEVMP